MNGDDVVLAFFIASTAGTFALWIGLVRRHADGFRRVPAIVAAANFSLFIAVSGLLLSGAEVYFRFIYDRTDAFGLMKTSDAWFRRHRHLNPSGFRDDIEYTLVPPPETVRITVIGDSFTEGHGVDVGDRFVNRLRKILPARVQVHAIAQNGWNTEEELTAFNRLIEAGYQTGEVLLIYCLNDITDLVPEWNERMKPVWDDVQNEGFFLRSSYALNYLYYRLAPRRHPVLRNYDGFLFSAYGGAPWQAQAVRLSGFAVRLSESGIKLRVVTFPFLQDLGPSYAYRDAHRQLEAFWKSLGVPHLDLLPLLERHDPNTLMVNHRDPHPNEFAHGIAADAIAAFLLKGQ